MSEIKNDARQAVLDAALKLFSQKGFSATTTREISREAGYAEGTIFRYFPTKKDLLIALVRPPALEELERVLEGLSRTDEERNLRSIIENRMQVVAKHKDLLKILFTEGQFHPEIKDEFYQNIGIHIVDALAGYMKERMKKEVFRSADPVIVSRIFVGMFFSLILTKNFLPMENFDEKKQEEYFDEIINIFLQGMRKRREEK